MVEKNQIFLLISLLVVGCSHVQTKNVSTLPTWITASSNPSQLTCSADGLDPEETRQRAETNCLSSAAKSRGVTLNINQKTVDSLSGSDSGESVQFQETHKVRCEFTNRYLQQLDSGFRVWLQCRIKESERVGVTTIPSHHAEPLTESYKRTVLQVVCVPACDTILVGGLRGERVIQPTGNTTTIELKEGDHWIEGKRQKYEASKIAIPNFSHGDSLSLTVTLSPDI